MFWKNKTSEPARTSRELLRSRDRDMMGPSSAPNKISLLKTKHIFLLGSNKDKVLTNTNAIIFIYIYMYVYMYKKVGK